MILCSENVQKKLEEVIADFVNSIKTTTLKKRIEEKDFSDRELYVAAVKLAYLDAARTFSGIDKAFLGSDNPFSKTVDAFSSYFKSQQKEEEFNKVHDSLCKSVQEDFEKFGYRATYGQAQKIVNMTFKYLYCAPKRNAEYNCFMHCHMTLDSYILSWFRRTVLEEYNKNEKDAGRSCIKKEHYNKVKWSALENSGDQETPLSYIWIQSKIAAYLISEKSKYRDEKGKPLSPFFAEFLIWKEEQIRQTKYEIQKSIDRLYQNQFYLSEEDKKEIQTVIKKLAIE